MVPWTGRRRRRRRDGGPRRSPPRIDRSFLAGDEKQEATASLYSDRSTSTDGGPSYEVYTSFVSKTLGRRTTTDISNLSIGFPL